ncbi:hypothetical protein R2602_04940 [Streptococcus pyogenes]|uniref:hypothetical protein n=1 Tax=Streptococcus pyogenes TaxID=1314 RepID=UPI00109D77EF|nr:hypothetical protein [Streptococcus pyogenes]VHA62720.1 Uncharacterised protein [Streptococcus pyogenes]VHC20427.1 Uncharacterised protein [Streptococcus pyogenes]VHD18334.1 Uncharacterised protein [Streptococcus pyogenes]VHD27119.1 Uncharacterised protein [Streptococcus pyogenes]
MAVLFLALFGTVLLISRPVSADFKGQMDTVTQSDEVESESDRWKKDRDFGSQRGLEDGKTSYGPNISRDDILLPPGIQNPDDYKDGYQEGYSQGWHQEHPLLGVIFDVFDSIWNVMSGLFNGVN